VVRHDQVRVAGHQQLAGVDVAAGQVVDLLQHERRVDDHAVADDRDHAAGQHTAGQQVQRVLLTGDDDGVAGVVAALVADDVVDAVAEQVGRLALALVAPLGAEQDHRRHGKSFRHNTKAPVA
jgi:hypothetical protein